MKNLMLAIGLVLVSTSALAFDPCRSYDGDAFACRQQSSCKWIGALNECESLTSDCRSLGNKWSCDQDAGCVWSGNACWPRLGGGIDDRSVNE